MSTSTETKGAGLVLEYSSGVILDQTLIKSEDIALPWGNKEADLGKTGVLKKTIALGATLTQRDDTQGITGYSDREVAEQLLRTAVPLAITGDRRIEPLILAAQLQRLPIRNGEGDEYELFILRLKPIQGAIETITGNTPSIGSYNVQRRPKSITVTTASRRVFVGVYLP